MLYLHTNTGTFSKLAIQCKKAISGADKTYLNNGNLGYKRLYIYLMLTLQSINNSKLTFKKLIF